MIAPVKIAGIGEGLPKTIITNKMMEDVVDTSDEWIKQRTGIQQRHILTDDSIVSISIKACMNALDSAGVTPDEIGMTVACTLSSDYITPSLAGCIQKSLGLPYGPAFDLSAGCTGFIYALVSAASLMDTLAVDTALVVSGEGLSRKINWSDRASCVLFGDGAGAVVLKKSKTACLNYPLLMGKSDTNDVLVIKNNLDDTPWHVYDKEQNDKLQMKGREVFEFASEVLATTLEYLKEKCGDKPFNKIIPHQANTRIIDYVSRITGFKQDQFFLNLSRFANTSSASIPLALWDAYKQGWLVSGDRLALVGFGSGLTWGGVVVDWTLDI